MSDALHRPGDRPECEWDTSGPGGRAYRLWLVSASTEPCRLKALSYLDMALEDLLPEDEEDGLDTSA